MFSNEMWFNLDAPIGNTLWNARAQNMDDYIRACNQIGHVAGSGPCNVTFSDSTQHGVSREDLLTGKYATSWDEYQHRQNGNMNPEEEEEEERRREVEDEEEEDRDYYNDEEEAEGYSDSRDEVEEEDYYNDDGGDEYWPEDERFAPRGNYFSAKEEPNFLVPKGLKPGEMSPLYWRDNRERLKDDEAYVIGLPEELLSEFTTYIENSGMLRIARKLSYPETNTGTDKVEEFDRSLEHKIYTLEDGKNWGTMRPSK